MLLGPSRDGILGDGISSDSVISLATTGWDLSQARADLGAIGCATEMLHSVGILSGQVERAQVSPEVCHFL